MSLKKESVSGEEAWKIQAFMGLSSKLSFFVMYMFGWAIIWNRQVYAKMISDFLWRDCNWFTAIPLTSVLGAHYCKVLSSCKRSCWRRLNLIFWYECIYVQRLHCSLRTDIVHACYKIFLVHGIPISCMYCNKASIAGQVGWQPKVMYTALGLCCLNYCLGDGLLIKLRWVWSRTWQTGRNHILVTRGNYSELWTPSWGDNILRREPLWLQIWLYSA